MIVKSAPPRTETMTYEITVLVALRWQNELGFGHCSLRSEKLYGYHRKKEEYGGVRYLLFHRWKYEPWAELPQLQTRLDSISLVIARLVTNPTFQWQQHLAKEIEWYDTEAERLWRHYGDPPGGNAANA